MNVEDIFDIDELCDGGYITADYVRVSKEEYNKDGIINIVRNGKTRKLFSSNVELKAYGLYWI